MAAALALSGIIVLTMVMTMMISHWLVPLDLEAVITKTSCMYIDMLDVLRVIFVHLVTPFFFQWGAQPACCVTKDYIRVWRLSGRLFLFWWVHFFRDTWCVVVVLGLIVRCVGMHVAT